MPKFNLKKSQMSELIQRYHQLGSQFPLSKLIAVSKTYPFSDIATLYQLGQRNFGEARIRELQEKAAKAHDAGMYHLRWHYIGRIQRKQIVPLLKIPQLQAIHSIASLSLLEELVARRHLLDTCRNKGDELDFFLQFNTGHEPQKAGFSTDEDLAPLFSLLRSVSLFPLRFAGLMCMAPLVGPSNQAFADLRQLGTVFARAGFANLELSMGMSGDYQTALEYGSDWVRIGRALFG